MNLKLFIPLLVLGLISLSALFLLPKIWRSEADVQRPEATEKWWPFGEALRESFVRGLPVGILAANALTLTGVLVLVEESTSGSASRTAADAAWIAFLVFLALILVDAFVTLFNWPKIIVPPAARDEPGALALWWRGRRYRRSGRSRRRA